MPVLYGESLATATAFLNQVDLSGFADPFDTERILQYIDSLAPGNTAVKASLDIALHDLIGKLLQLPVHRYFGLPAAQPYTSMTIGVDTPDEMAKKALKYNEFRYLKIKLGTADDRAMITAIRSVTQQPFFIDANQGWKNKEEALELIHWLKAQGTVFIEQPMPREDITGNAWLTERSPLPTVGDEAVQRLADISRASSTYHGINIKLMKCTGIREGFKMAVTAKALGMKVMLGCMTETSCAISAAAQLAGLADWVDLDGHLDTVNNPYTGIGLSEGQLVPTGEPGIGITPGPAEIF